MASYKLKKSKQSNEVTSIQKFFKRVPIFDSWNSRVNVEFLIQGKKKSSGKHWYTFKSYLGTKETDGEIYDLQFQVHLWWLELAG